MRTVDRVAATARCRCQDPRGLMWIYLNAYCLHRDSHRPWDDYGFPETSIVVSAREYARAWLAGEYNDTTPPEARPGYRPPSRKETP